ncbi:MAG: deoxyribonuclease IV [Pirellula sp.]|jgi:deoxyribonuclease-4|nr:deoxyribonuclease IV [Pirellula sp.]
MAKIGAHMSVAGGFYKAVEAAKALHMDVVQIFTKNNNQWAAKPITSEDEKLFHDALKSTGVTRPLAHASYLINLASPKEELWEKSIDGMVIEWQRADQLELDGVVMHPGAFVESNEEIGLRRIIDGLNRVHEKANPKRAWLLLENTAGQGSTLGWNMEQLGFLLSETGESMQIGICFDTCHAHAAGYDMSTSEGMKAWEKDAKKHGVLDAIRALHLNDSKKPCGSRVDRHEHIGFGSIGLEGFQRVLKHKVLKQHPMYLETDKATNDEGVEWDLINMQTLRNLDI